MEEQSGNRHVPTAKAIMVLSGALEFCDVSGATISQTALNESASSASTDLVIFGDQSANIVAVKSETLTADKAELKTVFNGLAKKWKEETGGYTLTMRRYAHPSYQAMLALEPKREVISLILSELRERPDRWFEALKALTDSNPAVDAKTFNESVQRWVSWGKSEKYIS